MSGPGSTSEDDRVAVLGSDPIGTVEQELERANKIVKAMPPGRLSVQDRIKLWELHNRLYVAFGRSIRPTNPLPPRA